MALIQPRNPSNSSFQDQSESHSYSKLMPTGKYVGLIVDIGFTQNKEKTKNILYVTLCREDKQVLSPRLVRSRFDLWNDNKKIVGYAAEDFYYFCQALQIYDIQDSEDPQFLDKLIQKALFKRIEFIVEKLSSPNGFSFNVVKKFSPASAIFKQEELVEEKAVVKTTNELRSGYMIQNNDDSSGINVAPLSQSVEIQKSPIDLSQDEDEIPF